MSSATPQRSNAGVQAADTRTAARPSDVLVPLVDVQTAGRIYDPSILSFTRFGALVGALVIGWLAFAIARGSIPVAGFGQFGAGGLGPAVVAGAGIGAALGSFAGGLTAVMRLAPRRPTKRPMPRGGEREATTWRNHE